MDVVRLEATWNSALEDYHHERYLQWSALREHPELTHDDRILHMQQWDESMAGRVERINRMADELDDLIPRDEDVPAGMADQFAELKRFHQLAGSESVSDKKERAEIAKKLETVLQAQLSKKKEAPASTPSPAEADEIRQLKNHLRDYHHHARLVAEAGEDESLSAAHSRSEMLRIAEILQNHQPVNP